MPDGRSGVDIGIVDGTIAVVQPELQAEAREERMFRQTGDAALRGRALPHGFHTYPGQPRLNRSGTLLEGIAPGAS